MKQQKTGQMHRAMPSRFLLCYLLTLALLSLCSLPAAAAKKPLHITALHAVTQGEEHLLLTGNVTVSDDDFSVQGQELLLDLENNTAQFTGEVSLSLKDQSLKGENLWLNLDTREWRFHNARTEIQPAFFGTGVEKPVYLFGEELNGTTHEIHLLQGGFTTCNLPHPHYSLKASDVLIIVGDKLTAHGGSLWAGRERLVTFPSFSLPLKPIRRPPYLPEVGRSRLEGMFVKTSYNYTATKKGTGTLLLDLTELQGTATALNHKYSLPLAAGEIYLYRQWKRDALNGRLTHRQTLAPRLKLDSSAYFVRNTYYSTAASTNINSGNTLRYEGPDVNTSLTLSTSSTHGTSTSSNLSGNLRHSQELNQRLSLNLSTNLQNNGVPGGFRDKELHSTLQLSGQAPNFNWRLTREKRDDPDGDSYTGDNNYTFIDRLPELVLQTATDRLPWNPIRPVRADLQLLLSKTTERRSQRDLFKGSLDVRSSTTQIPFSPSSTLNVSGGFKQSFYEGGTAQYVLQTNADWRNQLGGDWKASLRYAYRNAAGFSPFDFDFVSPQNSLDLDFSLDNPTARVLISSGYDLRRATYRDALLRANFPSSPRTSLSLSTAYNIENARFRPLVVRYSRQGQEGQFSLDAGLRYDLDMGKPTTLLSRLDWPISSQWRLEAFSGYNGIRKRFDYNDLRLTKDLHCFIATLTYSQQRNDLRFNLMIKAFPILDRYFGVGAFGQQFGTGIGEQY